MTKIDLNDTRKSFLPYDFTYLPEFNVVQVQAVTSASAVIISRSLAQEQLSSPDLPPAKRKIYQRALEILDENKS